MRITILILLYLAAFYAQAGTMVTVTKSENTAVLDTATANSCQPTLVEHYSRQSIYELSQYPSKRHALVTQEFELGRGCFESYSPAKITVTARPIDISSGKAESTQLWSFTTQGVKGEVQDGIYFGIYSVEMPGCCGSGETTKYYSLDTG